MAPDTLKLLLCTLFIFRMQNYKFALISQSTLALDLVSFWYAFLASSAFGLALVFQSVSPGLDPFKYFFPAIKVDLKSYLRCWLRILLTETIQNNLCSWVYSLIVTWAFNPNCLNSEGGTVMNQCRREFGVG